MKTFTEYLKEGEKRWKQTSMSWAEAIKKYGKENVKVKKGGLRNGDDMVEVFVESQIMSNEAVGDPAAPLYDLIDDVGSHQLVLDELVRFLDVDQIEEFVADFRRHHDMNHPGEDGDYGDDDKNFESVTEAGGYYTQPVYDLIEKHGYEKVMHELLTSLHADAIQSFLQRAEFDESVAEADGELDYLRKLAGI